MGRPTAKDVETDLMAEVKKHYELASTAEHHNRLLALDDIRFTDQEGGQWDEETLRRRGRERPAYTFDRLTMAIDQVKGDQRQNTPRTKIRPNDSKSSKDVAKVLEGHIRSLQAKPQALAAVNNAFDFALKGGYGVWRLLPKYVDDKSFRQTVSREWVENPFSVLFDAAARDPHKRDAGHAFVSEWMGSEDFEAEYGEKELKSSFNGGIYFDRDWWTHDQIRVAEYYKRIRKKSMLALLSNGQSVPYKDIKLIEDELANPVDGSEPITVEQTREIDGTSIRWWKISGAGILEGPIDYEWKYIPLVPVWGRCSNVEGERKYRGIVRKARDPQKAYNYSRTAEIEAVGLVPRAPHYVTVEQIKGFEWMWDQANTRNFPYLHYNRIQGMPNDGKPTREPMPEVPQALMQLAAQAADDIKAATGKFGASLGEPAANELPGAIRQRMGEGDVATFEFTDNLAMSLLYEGEILVDMLPKVITDEQILETLSIDGKVDFATVNQRMPNGQIKNDLANGSYMVSVDTGPAYTTQRQEAADNLMQLAGVSEMVQQAAPDLIASLLDFEGADRLEKRLRYTMIQKGMIPPSEMTEEDQKNMPPPPPPNKTEEALAKKLEAEAMRAVSQGKLAEVTADNAANGRSAEQEKHDMEMRMEMTKLVGQMLDNMLKQGEIGIDHSTGKVGLMKHMLAQEKNRFAAQT